MNSHRDIVVVTGSSGFIGAPVVERLADQFDVVALDRPGAPHPPPAAECVEVDLTSQESVVSGLQHVRQHYGDRIVSVIHLAAYYDFSGEPSPLYEELTVRGTQRLLHTLQQGFHVEQFVFTSTMLVHAPCQRGQRINEDWPLKPVWHYPKSKVRTEELLRAEHGEIPVVNLRIAGVYDDDCHSIPLSHQIQRIRERWLTSHVFPGETSHGQSFVHLDDLIDAILLVTQRRAQLPAEIAVLIGEPETLSYDELQRDFGRLIHAEEWETTQIPKAVARMGAWVQDNLPMMEEPFIKPWMIDLADDHYALDISRARTLLGWEPRRSLRDTIPSMIASLQADPLRWYREHNLKPPEELAEASFQSTGKTFHAG